MSLNFYDWHETLDSWKEQTMYKLGKIQTKKRVARNHIFLRRGFREKWRSEAAKGLIKI